MKKNSVCLLLTVITLCSAGCAGQGTPAAEGQVSSLSSKVTEGQGSSVPSDRTSSAPSEQESSSDKVQEVEKLRIVEAREFHDGFAWVKTDNNLCFVDKTGRVIKSFPQKYAVREDFYNGLSVVDPKAVITRGGNFELSEDAFVINTQGDAIFTIGNEGYAPYNRGGGDDTTDYTFGGIDCHSVMVIKNIDEFEKSGDYYYHYNLDTKIETEADPVRVKNPEYYEETSEVLYIGSGYYWKTYYDAVGRAREDEILNFYNYNSGKVLSFRKDPVVEKAFGGSDIKFRDWSIHRFDNGTKVFAHVETDMQKFIFEIDLIKGTCKLVPFEYEKGYSNITGAQNAYFYDDSNLPDYTVAMKTSKNLYYYDSHSNKVIDYAPNVDYKCSIKEYANGRFLVITKNKNDTVFFTIIENNKELFTPKRFSDLTAFMGDFVVFDSDAGVQIMDLKSNSIQSEIASTKLVYSDRTNNTIWVSDDSSTYTKCYDVTTGEMLFELNEGVTLLSDFSDEMVAVSSISGKSVYYVSKSGERIDIYKTKE